MDNACETEGRIRTAAHCHSHELRFTTSWTRFTLSTTNRSLTIASQRMRSCPLLECCAMLAAFSFRQETEIQSSMSDSYLCIRDCQEASLEKLNLDDCLQTRDCAQTYIVSLVLWFAGWVVREASEWFALHNIDSMTVLSFCKAHRHSRWDDRPQQIVIITVWGHCDLVLICFKTG